MTSRRSTATERLDLWTLGPVVVVVGAVLVALWQQSSTLGVSESLLPASGGRAVTSMAFCGPGGQLVLGWDDGTVFLWDPTTASHVSLPAHGAAVTDVAATGDGRLIATAAQDGVLRLWDPREGKLREERRCFGICRLRFSADGTRLAWGTGGGQVEIWDVMRGARLPRPEPRPDAIWDLEFSADGRALIVTSPNLTQVWDVPRGCELACFNNLEFTPLAVAFCAGGQQLLMVDYRETVTRWDLATGRRLEMIPGRRRPACLAFSPAAGALAAASLSSGEVRIRDATSAGQVARLQHMGPQATLLAFAPDGRRLAVAGTDGSVRAWDLGAGVDDPPWRAAIQRRAERSSGPLAVCFAAGLAGCCLVAVANWRRGLWLCFVFDLLRDPVRKLLCGHPVWVTASLAILWLALGLGVLWRDRQALVQLWRSQRGVRLAFFLSVLAILPGAVISLLAYPSGWQLVLLGSGSYGFAWLGLVLGWAWPRSPTEGTRLLAVFCGVHAVGLLGSLPEAWRCNLAVLGGIDADWYRSFTTGWTRLVSGLYRSPEVLGWHAATLVMFAAILLAVSAAARTAPGHGHRGRTRVLWLGIVLLGGAGLMLAGRRKMTVMPLVFLATWLIGGWRDRRRRIVLAALAGAILAAWLPLRAVQRSPHAPEIVKYLAWTPDDTIERAAKTLQGSWGTGLAAGPLGHGLGTATQGRYHLRAVGPRLWQEDGLGRALAETGVYGTVLMLAAVACLGLAAWSTIVSDPASRWLRLPLAGVVLANLVCYAVSHQLYSGDPTIAAMTGLCLGLALAPTLTPFPASLLDGAGYPP